jgi:hypothetical protein
MHGVRSYLPIKERGSLESDICDMSVRGTVDFHHIAWWSMDIVGQHATRKRSVSSLGAVA